MSELEQFRRDVISDLQTHARAISELQRIAQAQHWTELPSPDSRNVEEMLSRQQHYANTITLIGYGGFFALWASVAETMPSWLFATCGLLITISLIVFVLWEILRMRVISRLLKEALLPEGHSTPLPDAKAIPMIVTRAAQFDARFHAVMFWSSTVTGVAAGLGLLAYFVTALIRHAI